MHSYKLLCDQPNKEVVSVLQRIVPRYLYLVLMYYHEPNIHCIRGEISDLTADNEETKQEKFLLASCSGR